jgi:hypothetical protein
MAYQQSSADNTTIRILFNEGKRNIYQIRINIHQPPGIRYNSRQPLLTINKIPKDSIPVDIYQYPESTIVKFDNVPIMEHIKPISNTHRWKYEILRHLEILDISKMKQSLESKRLIPT